MPLVRRINFQILGVKRLKFTTSTIYHVNTCMVWKYTLYATYMKLEQAWIVFKLHEKMLDNLPRGGGLPYKNDRDARRKVSKKPLIGTRILISGRSPN